MRKFVLYYPEKCIEEIYDTLEELVEKLTERIEDGSYEELGYIDIQKFDVEKGKWAKKMIFIIIAIILNVFIYSYIIFVEIFRYFKKRRIEKKKNEIKRNII